MKNNNLNQCIQETLELCLSKMSKKLKDNFDPEDKNSIKLLQQFRSTLSTLRSWIKHTSTVVNESINTAKDALKNTVNKVKSSCSHHDQPSILDKYPKNKEHVRLMALMNQPSGLMNQPSGLMNQPSGLMNQPSGLMNQPSGLRCSSTKG